MSNLASFVVSATSNSFFGAGENPGDLLVIRRGSNSRVLLGNTACNGPSVVVDSNSLAVQTMYATTSAINELLLGYSVSNGVATPTSSYYSGATLTGYSNTPTGTVLSVSSNTSNYAFTFKAGSSTVAQLQGNGYLGVGGQAAPQYALDVAGSINFAGGALLSNGVPFASGGASSQWSNAGSNVYVTGSNVGIGKSNPAYPLDVAGDLNFTGTLRQGGVAFSAGSLTFFRNRIINGDMRVNQRGYSSNSGSTNAWTLPAANGSVYGLVDRFITGANAASGSVYYTNVALSNADLPYSNAGLGSSMRFTSCNATSVNFIACGQVVEANNVSDLHWGTAVGQPASLSFWMRTSLPAGSNVAVAVRNYDAGSAWTSWASNVVVTGGSNVWQYATVPVPAPPTGSTWNSGSNGGLEVYLGSYLASNTSSGSGWSTGTTTSNASGYGISASNSALWWASTGGYVEFTGVQLEKGSTATAFEFRPYALELALCQRYYYQIAATAPNAVILNTGAGLGAGGIIYAHMQHPVSMRVPATLSTSTVSTYFYFAGQGGGGSVSAITDLSGSALNFGGTTYSNVIDTTRSSTLQITTAGAGNYPELIFIQPGGYVTFAAEL